MTYGFPGQIPQAGRGKDRTKILKFFEFHAKGLNVRESANKAGLSDTWAHKHSWGYLKKYADYLQWLQAHFAQVAAKTIDVDQERVLQEMAAIAFVNEYDYLVFEKDNVGRVRARRKRLDELTREQMIAIKVYRRPGSGKEEILDYKLRDKEGRLLDLGKKLGFFNQKLILEHRRLHIHKFDLSQVPLEQLEELERQYEAVLDLGEGRTLEKPIERGHDDGEGE